MVAIVGVLAAILIPVVGKVRNKAHETTCASNLRQLHMAIIAMSNENNGVLPAAQTTVEDGNNQFWVNAVLDYVDYPDSEEFKAEFSCPSWEGNSAGKHWYLGYAYNENPAYMGDSSGITKNTDNRGENYRLKSDGSGPQYNLSVVTFPSNRLMFIDSKAWHINKMVGSKEEIQPDFDRHGDSCNAVFFDGHVESMNSLEAVRLSVADPQKYSPDAQSGEG
ncbi:prepilin-type N-terminal cleavage/methylation domain-containing protein [Cerasicoccus fimbriatus]|uniref:prepilin-type N-terminal cleavage/methylation domain-containing protein n=1 Tax=Cerasicoccus fimbriatus TaxID=3014554 RepID=UPI0022B53E4E|nr:hypothetical protein [Cerasicoccus sp. TK19100]